MRCLLFLLVVLFPVASIADGAVGLGALKKGVSLWNVRSEGKTMWGIELEKLWGVYERIDFGTGFRETKENQSSVRVSLTRKRLRAVNEKVSLFGYQSAFFNWDERRWGDRREFGVRYLDLGLGFGLGVFWYPADRIGIALRQGLEFDFGNERQELSDRDDPREADINKTRRLRGQMAPVRLLVLVKF